MKLGRHGELLPVRGFSRVKADLPVETATAWVSHDGLRVVTSIEQAYLPGSGEPPLVGPQWLVSVSRRPPQDCGFTGRCWATDADLARVVDCFAMPAFDEDNHHPGVARHLWCPVDAQYQQACECKLDERTVVEADGYRWTTPVDEAKCRGCEFELLTRGERPCTLHHPANVS